MTTKSNSTVSFDRFYHGVRHQLLMLSVQFLLGMAANLIGTEASGVLAIATDVLIGLHSLMGAGLVIGSITTLVSARRLGPTVARSTLVAAIVLWGTFVAGVLTVMTKNDGWSFAMAVGFMADFLLYGRVYADRNQAGGNRGE